MPNGYDYSKEYGHHKYRNDDGQGKCQHDCGCYMGGCHSGGPIGLDPFGECPNNPKDGKQVGGSADHEIVVERRLCKFASDLDHAEECAKKAEEIAEKGAALLQKERDEVLRRLNIYFKSLDSIHKETEKALTSCKIT